MTKKVLSLVSALALVVMFKATAQDASEALVLSGSVDTYYKFDLSSPTGGSPGNIGTSYAEVHNAFSLGMFNLIATQSVGKATFVGDIAFGPRSQASTPGVGVAGDLGFIQNLYASYMFNETVSFTMGFMGTHLGYEVISPTGNFNYSTSYLFTSGPFNTAGAKLDFTFSDQVTLMVGLFNNGYSDQGIEENDGKALGVQLGVSPSEMIDLYFNILSDPNVGTEFDLTAGFQFTDDFYLGLNLASFESGDSTDLAVFSTTDDAGFFGVALYPQYSVSEVTTLGLRLESFQQDAGFSGAFGEGSPEVSVFAITATANVAAGPLNFIPEVRFDSASKDLFNDSDGQPTSSAIQASVALVYGF